MDESDIWSVDHLAANNLLARLGVEPADDVLALVEQHFAEHRRTAMEWAAKRSRASILETLEETSQRYFPHQGEEWCAGYCRAQQQAAAITVREMLQLNWGKVASKGQILRGLLRRARQK